MHTVAQSQVRIVDELLVGLGHSYLELPAQRMLQTQVKGLLASFLDQTAADVAKKRPDNFDGRGLKDTQSFYLIASVVYLLGVESTKNFRPFCRLLIVVVAIYGCLIPNSIV